MNTIEILLAFNSEDRAQSCYKEMANTHRHFTTELNSMVISDKTTHYTFVGFGSKESLYQIMGLEFTAIIFEDDLPESQRRYILSRVRKRVFN